MTLWASPSTQTPPFQPLQLFIRPQSRDEATRPSLPCVRDRRDPPAKGAPMKTPLAIAALVVATVTVSALPACAQDAGANPPPAATAAQHDNGQGPGKGMGPMGRGMRNGPFPMLALACSDQGPAKLDKMFDRTDKRLDLSTDQQKLFEAFKAKALTAESDFSDACL